MAKSLGQLFSRRRVLGAVAAAAATPVVVGSSAAAAPSHKGIAEAGRVTEVSGASVTAIGGASGRTYPNLRLYGFPEDFAPRVGDRVTVSDILPEVGLVAMPVCSWVSGAPTLVSGGAMSIAGRRVTGLSARLAASGQTSVSVCLLDTEREDSQVLAERTAAE